MRRKAVTIRDVAKHAGVGVSTVSYVLNGDEQHVSAATREQILAAVRELNYRPNAIARSMVKRKTTTIGLIITELENPLFVPITGGIEEVLSAEGYQILLARADDVQAERKVIEMMRSQQVDGFIFMSLSLRWPTDHLSRLQDEEIPFVVVNRDLDPGMFNQILFNDHDAGRRATEYLIGLGHRDIGTITGARDGAEGRMPRRSAQQRHQGYIDAMQGAGLSVRDEWMITGWYTFEGGYEAIQQLLRRPQVPSALFAASDVMAMGALCALHELGLRVPQDIAIITVGDPPGAAFTVPPLTTMALPIEEAGRVAARMLTEWLHGKKLEANQYVVLDLELKIRKSC